MREREREKTYIERERGMAELNTLEGKRGHGDEDRQIEIDRERERKKKQLTE